MATYASCMTAQRLELEGWELVPLPVTDESPIPGWMLFAKPDQRQLLRVNPDGTTTDLFAAPEELSPACYSIKISDIVQLDPEKTGNPAFSGCLMIVTEVKGWGVQGYVQALGDRSKPGGQAYYRAENGTFARCGTAIWW